MSEDKTHPHDVRTFRKETRPATIRKNGKDGSLSPTEQRTKNRLMKQFAKSGRKGYELASGVSKEFRENYDRIKWK